MPVSRTHSVQQKTKSFGRFKRESIGVLLAGGVIAAMIGWYAYISSPQPRAYSDNISGSIVISSTRRTDCQLLEFNNANGNIKNMGRGDCPTRSSSQGSRVGEISSSFWQK